MLGSSSSTKTKTTGTMQSGRKTFHLGKGESKRVVKNPRSNSVVKAVVEFVGLPPVLCVFHSLFDRLRPAIVRLQCIAVPPSHAAANFHQLSLPRAVEWMSDPRSPLFYCFFSCSDFKTFVFNFEANEEPCESEKGHRGYKTPQEQAILHTLSRMLLDAFRCFAGVELLFLVLRLSVCAETEISSRAPHGPV